MPFASHRLDLILVPADRQLVPDPRAFEVVLGAWRDEGLLPGGEGLVEGGLADVLLDLPRGPVLYANQQGGFRVRCGACGVPLARDFGRAVEAWRRGGDFAMGCPACGVVQALDALDVRPPLAFGEGAVVFVDVGGTALGPGVLRALEPVVGPQPKVVLRRPV